MNIGLTNHSKGVPIPPPTGDTLTPADFTNLVGGFKMPPGIPTSWGSGLQSFYGDGFTMKYELNDGGRLHALSHGYNQDGYNPTLRPLDNQYTIYQIRVPTLSNPASPKVWNNWNSADISFSKAYSAQGGSTSIPLSGGYGTRRVYNDNGSIGCIENILTGQYGLYYDLPDDRLYETVSFGYSTACQSWSFQWLRPNYSTGSVVTAEGPWKMTGAGFKATGGWLSRPPNSWSSTYTPGKPLIIGSGAMASQVASCDVSLGLCGFSFTPPIDGQAVETSLSNTPLVGYWPTTGSPSATSDRSDRNTYILPGRTSVALDPNWGPNKHSQGDYVRGAQFIDTGTKRGFVCIVRLVQGQFNYVSSSTGCEYIQDWIYIYDIGDIQDVISGSVSREDIQPLYRFQIQWPIIDYNDISFYPYVPPTAIPISSITSITGASVQISTQGALVNTSIPHNIPSGNVSVRGTSRDSEYGAVWSGVVTSPTQVQIYNTSENSQVWSGISASGGNIYRATAPIPNTCEPKGMWYDSTTKRVWFAESFFAPESLNGIDPRWFQFCYQLP